MAFDPSTARLLEEPEQSRPFSFDASTAKLIDSEQTPSTRFDPSTAKPIQVKPSLDKRIRAGAGQFMDSLALKTTPDQRQSGVSDTGYTDPTTDEFKDDLSRVTPGRVGRAETAASSFVKGAGAIPAGVMRGISIQDAERNSNTVKILDAIDAGEITADNWVEGISKKLGGFASDLNNEDVTRYLEGDKSVREKYADAATDPRHSTLFGFADDLDRYLADKFKTDPEFAEEFVSGKVPAGLGSMLGFMATTLVGRGAGMPGMFATTAYTGGQVNAAAQFEDAVRSGADLDQAFEAADVAALVGMSEAAPIISILNRIDKTTGGGLKKAIVNALKGGTEEAIQEGFQGIMTNVIASDIVEYDPERGMFVDTGEEAGVGFTVGALVSFIGSLFPGGRKGKVSTHDMQALDDAVLARNDFPDEAGPGYIEPGAARPIPDINVGDDLVDSGPGSPAETLKQEPTLADIANASDKDLDAMVDAFLAESTTEPQTGKDRRTDPERAGDRRGELEKRSIIQKLPPEEQEVLLRSDVIPALKGKRAFEIHAENNPDERVLFFDFDDFKAVNDRLGEEETDASILAPSGEIIQAAARDAGINVYHRSGDEFLAAGASDEALEQFAESLRKRLKSTKLEATLPDGTKDTIEGIEFSYGIDRDEKTARTASKRQKEQRRLAGQRTGARDKRMDEPAPAGDQVSSGAKVDGESDSRSSVRGRTDGSERNDSDVARQRESDIKSDDPRETSNPKLKREVYRAQLKRFSESLIQGSGGELVGGDFSEANWQVARGKETPVQRLPSLNPEWFKRMNADPEYTMSVKNVQAAVDKALKGERMGVRQARVVDGILAEIEGKRTEPDEIGFKREELARSRQMRKLARQGINPNVIANIPVYEYEGVAGEMYAEAEYDAEWTGQARSLFELANEAEQLGLVDEVEGILSKNQPDREAAKQLYRLIANTYERREQQPISVEEAAREPGKRPQTDDAQDLFGKAPVKEQQIANAKRSIDEKLKGTEDIPVEAGDGDLFSGRSRQVDFTQEKTDEKQTQKQAPAETEAVLSAANEAATSPKNNLSEPTEAQREAGNYKLGHIRFNGFDVSIENPAGSRRRPEWPKLKHAYGYLKGTVGKDKDHIDVFLSEDAANPNLPVFVVDQVNRDGKFDEHKVMMGFADEQSAREGYLSNYSKGWTGLGAITEMSLDDFKAWAKSDTSKPAGTLPKPDKRTAEPVAESRARDTSEPRDSEVATTQDSGARGKPLYSKTKSPSLSVTHNLSAENLVFADKVGGLAVPSMAVVNTDVDVMTGFGEITLIADKDLIDPQKSKASKVFDADVYSPRYPTVKFKPSDKGLNALRADVREAADELGLSIYSMDKSEIEDKGLGALYEWEVLQYAYLKQEGKAPKLAYRKKEKLPKELERFKNTPAHELRNSEEFSNALTAVLEKEVEAYVDKLEAHVDKLTETGGFTDRKIKNIRKIKRGEYFDSDGDIHFRIMDRYASAVAKADSPPEIDNHAMANRLRKAVEKDQDSFRKWAFDNYGDVIEGERIFNGFTYSGKKKWLPHDLDTVVRILKKGLRDGEGVNYGPASIRSTVAKQFRTIKQIQDSKDKIISDAEFGKLKDEVMNEFSDLSDRFRDKYKYTGTDFGFMDAFSEVIKEGAKRGRLAAELHKDFNVDDSDIQEVADFLDKLKNMPTEYFEAKVQRAVGLNEFVAAVVPKGTDQGAIDILKKNGIQIQYYDENDRESRRKAVQFASKKTGALFSKNAILPAGKRALGMRKETVQKMVSELLRDVKSDIEVSVQQTQKDATGQDAITDENGRDVRVKAVLRGNELIIIAENLNGRTDLESVIRHEVFWHYGFSLFDAKTRKAIEDRINATRNDPEYKETWDYVLDHYDDATEAMQANEFMAKFAEAPKNRLTQLWREILTMIQKALRALGWEGNITRSEIQAILNSAERAARRGEQEPDGAMQPAYSVAPGPFFSALTRAARGLKQETGTADQFLNQLKNQPGVKAEELEFTGLEEYLRARGPKKVTKQEIVDFLDANGVQVETIVKGVGKISKSDLRADAAGGDTWSIYHGDEYLGRVEAESEGDAISEWYTWNHDAEGDSAKFRKYQLPGGENYREVLLKLPSREQRAYVLFNEESGEVISRHKNRDEAFEELRDLPEGEKTLYGIKPARLSEEFKSSHFDEPNVLAHIRLNDRTDSEGRRVLFVEELQSDWHQAGRKKGYKVDNKASDVDTTGWSAREVEIYNEPFWKIVDKEGNHFYSIPFDDAKTQEEAITRAVEQKIKVDNSADGIPNAPFKNNAWAELAIKRVLRMAAEEGYDSVAWTTGEQQAERYDLSKQIDTLVWREQADGLFQIGMEKDGKTINVIDDVPTEKLPETVGKDLAEKIVDSASRDVSGEFSGIDLRVGGEGMKGFYDKILPNLFKKVAGKLDKSASIGRTSIDSGAYKVNRDSNSPPYRLEAKDSPTILSRHNTAEEAWAEAERLGASIVHAIQITDAMREGAMAGQPLFSKRKAQEGGSDTDPNILYSKTKPGTQVAPLIEQSDNLPALRQTEVVMADGRKIHISEEPIRRKDIVKRLEKAFGVRIYQGRVKGKSRLGFYRTGVGEIRTKHTDHLEVTAHELAHWLDDRYVWISTLYHDKPYKKEILSVSYDDKKIEEGYAEFMRMFFTDEAQAMEKAPNFYRAFVDKLKGSPLEAPVKDIQGMMHAWYRQGSLARADSKHGETPEGAVEQIKEVQEWLSGEAKSQLFDSLSNIAKVEKTLTGRVGGAFSPYWSARITQRVGAIMDAVIHHGTVGYDKATNSMYFTGESLDEAVLSKIEGRERDFGRYMIGRRAKELKHQGREILYQSDEISAYLDLANEHKDFPRIFQAYQAFNKRMINLLVESGVTSREKAEKIMEINQNYVSFKRVVDSFGKHGKASRQNNPFMRLKGGSANIRNVFETLQENMETFLRLSVMNQFKSQFYHLIDSSKDSAMFAAKIGRDVKPVQLNKGELAAKLNKILGDNWRDSGIQIDEELLSDLVMFTGVDPKGNVDFYYKDGEKVFYEIMDGSLYKDLIGIDGERLGLTFKIWDTVFGKPKRLLTATATAFNLKFQVRNFLMRDLANRIYFTRARKDNPIRIAGQAFKGLAESFKKSDAYWLARANGLGMESTYVGSQYAHVKKAGIAPAFNWWQRITGMKDKTIDNLIEFTGHTEMANRLAEYSQLIAEGKTPREAAVGGIDVSVDFRRHGRHELVRYIATGSAFFNPRVQGLYKIGEEMTNLTPDEKNTYIKKRAAVVAMRALWTTTLPAMALWFFNHDDERYQDLPDDVRDQNFVIFYGPGKDDYFLFAKSFEMGSVFASVPERILDAIKEKDGRELAESMALMAAETLSLNPMPSVLQVEREIRENKRWTGSPIIPDWLNDKTMEKARYFDDRTSQTARTIGEKLNIRPDHLEHRFRGYTSMIGDLTLTMTDYMLRQENQIDPKMTYQDYVSKYIGILPRSGEPYRTEAQKDFFALAREADKVFNTYEDLMKRPGNYKTLDQRLRDYLDPKERQVYYATSKAFKDARELITDLNNTADLIRLDTNMSAEKKREQMEQIKIGKNQIYRAITKEFTPEKLKELEQQIQ